MTNPSSTDTEADHADHEAFRTLKTLFEKAVAENNLDLLLPHLDENFSIVSFTNREFTTFESFKAQWQKTREQMLQGGTYALQLLPEHSTLLGDMALAKGDSKNILTTGTGQRHEFNSRWTVLLRKVAAGGANPGAGGQWRILRAHSSISPFDNSMLRAGVKKKVLQVSLLIGAIALIAGAVAGALIASMMHK